MMYELTKGMTYVLPTLSQPACFHFAVNAFLVEDVARSARKGGIRNDIINPKKCVRGIFCKLY